MSSNGSLKRPREGDDEAAAGTARPAAMPRIEAAAAAAAPAAGAVGVPQGGQPMINFPQVVLCYQFGSTALAFDSALNPCAELACGRVGVKDRAAGIPPKVVPPMFRCSGHRATLHYYIPVVVG